jgi:hypothetical protein
VAEGGGGRLREAEGDEGARGRAEGRRGPYHFAP